MAINPFIPELMKRTFPYLNLDKSTVVNTGVNQNSKTERQTVLIQMRQLLMSCLIWIYTVCIGICVGLLG